MGLEPGVDTLRAVALARLAPRGVSSMVEQRTFNPSTATAVQTCENARRT
jgi:hypothetical protein